jgi:hypothetical protein
VIVNLGFLQETMAQFKKELELAITTATFGNKEYENGWAAKDALIKSQRLIMLAHEATKVSLHEELERRGRRHEIYPPIGKPSPELKITGFIKAKKQDVVVLLDGDRPSLEKIKDGHLEGEVDEVGKAVSERSMVVGIRSQMSSVGKNFDTLMERAFAETLNLRLRLPGLVMGEVYLLPVVEYDDKKMKSNRIAFNKGSVPVEKFIRTFLAISGRPPAQNGHELYKYERTALVLVDFRKSPPKVYLDLDELKRDGHVSADFARDFHALSPRAFAAEFVKTHELRHPPRL